MTHVSVVRVNQIEFTSARSIGEDDAENNRPERVRSRHKMFVCVPGGQDGIRSNELPKVDIRQRTSGIIRRLSPPCTSLRFSTLSEKNS